MPAHTGCVNAGATPNATEVQRYGRAATAVGSPTLSQRVGGDPPHTLPGGDSAVVPTKRMAFAEFDDISHINDSPISGPPYRFWIRVRNRLL